MINEHDIKDMAPKGLKYDSDKPPIALVDPDYIEGIASVLGFGANKYAAHNWRGGIHYSRLISSAYRHLGAINRGEDNDPESGLPHVYHLACCNMFLASMMAHRPDLDDRWKPPLESITYKVTPVWEHTMKQLERFQDAGGLFEYTK